MSRARFHRWSVALIGLVVVLALAGWGDVALHQHPDGDASHSCAVCGAAHASAILDAGTAAGTPHLVSRRGVVAAVGGEPRESFRVTTRSRAPPTT